MLTLFRIAFGLVLLLKTLDIAVRGQVALTLVENVAIVALWAGCAVAITVGVLVRVSAVIVAILTFVVVWLGGSQMYNQHLYMILSICVILAIRWQVTLLLKLQLTIVYGFAALTKVNESFLSGSEFYLNIVRHYFWRTFVPWDPGPEAMIAVSVAAVLTEAFLAFALYRPKLRWFGLVIGLGLHLSMLLLVSNSVEHLIRLGVFSFLMLVLYIPFFEKEVDRVAGWLVTRFPALGRSIAFRDLAPHHHHRLRPVGQQGSLRDARELDPDPR